MRILAQESKGFTLIEVLIATALLALISIAIYQATLKSYDVNRSISTEADNFLNVTVGLEALERDVKEMYSPMLGTQPGAPPPEQANLQPSQFWSVPVRSDGLRRSRFLGTQQRISFITNSNRRLEADRPESDFLAVTWELEQNSGGTFTLYRSQDWDVYRYVDGERKKPRRIAVLTKINSGKFAFYRATDKTWDDNWDSEGRFVKPESRYPDLVALRLEIPDPRNPASNLSWEGVFRADVALNGDSAPQQTPQLPQPNQGGGR